MNQKRRLERLEALIAPPRTDGIILVTVEELCRDSWRRGKTDYLERAKNGDYYLRHFVTQFEQEDAERAQRQVPHRKYRY
jgi:hypothetical protein